MQDAYVQALRTWARDGVPDRPGAWLTTVARRTRAQRHAPPADARGEAAAAARARGHRDARAGSPTRSPTTACGSIFTCCHPALAPEAQVALTLRLVCGVATPDIAHAFLVAEPTMAARLTRAKKKIAAARIPYAVPAAAELPERVDAVLTVIHLLYADRPHGATRATELVRDELTDRALDLARMLRRAAAGRARGRRAARAAARPPRAPRDPHRRARPAAPPRGPGPLGVGPRADRRGRPR